LSLPGKKGAETHIATYPQIHYNFGVEYPFPPVGIVGAADGKNRRAFLCVLGLAGTVRIADYIQRHYKMAPSVGYTSKALPHKPEIILGHSQYLSARAV
jgi:hypothetical protein